MLPNFHLSRQPPAVLLSMAQEDSARQGLVRAQSPAAGWPNKPMRAFLFSVALLAALSWASLSTSAADDLRDMWAARTNSAEQLGAAINARFTHGTPMRQVLAVLGKQDIMHITTTLSFPPETQNRRTWVYWFGPKEILIQSTGGPMTPLDERGFAGAKVVTRDQMSQPNLAASGSQPVGSVTIETSSPVPAGEISREPRMALPERVAAANLIVLGKFGPPGNTGKRTTTSVKVDEVLRGSVPSGKTLWVSYTSSLWLIPEVAAASPGQVAPHGSLWIFFLTDTDVEQVPGTNYYTRAVGAHKYAHDGMELATEDVVKKIRDLVAEGKK